MYMHNKKMWFNQVLCLLLRKRKQNNSLNKKKWEEIAHREKRK